MEKGRLVISLDFELLWGVFDKVDHSEKVQYFNNTRKLIPDLLKLFEDHEVHVTWATVGMLFNKNWDQWMENFPENLPKYDKTSLSAYEYGLKNKHVIDENLCFASELINKIAKARGQEMATHTYSHYYCLENGQTIESFKADLEMTLKLADNYGINLESLVFPRNQFNSDYLEICNNFGIKSVRTNPSNWYWRDTQKDSLQQKVFRTGDAYLGFNDKLYYLRDIPDFSPFQQKASRLLRPKESGFKNELKLKRIFGELRHAAQNNKIYHLWWHPHNFGKDPNGNLEDLKRILDCFSTHRTKFGMCSNNMKEITSLLNS